MRKLIFGINMSIDGCCDHTDMMADESVHEYFTELTRETDILLYGRKTYQLMVPFWPEMAKSNAAPTKSIGDFAQAFVSVDRIIVFSRTLDDVEEENTTLLRGNLKEEILNLKQQPGRNILVGGVDLPSQLIELGLVDEYRIVIHPIVAGKGRRLFDDRGLAERPQIKLVESKTFPAGHAVLRYAR